MWIETLLLVATCLFLLYKYMTRNDNYFVKKNIPHLKPFLGLGNCPGVLFGYESIVEGAIRIHNSFKDKKLYGMFDMVGPVIVLRDAELIKQVTIKDADHFVNHREFMTELDDPMFGNAIFMMRNEKWKDMRSTLTPAFTGHKMRIMFHLIQECCEEVVKYVKSEMQAKQSDEIDIELKDFFTRFTNDVIGTSAFGIKVNSLVDRNNEFYVMGKKINSLDFWITVKMLLMTVFRPITRAVGMTVFDKEHVGYFKRLVLDAIKYREEHNIHRPDMINMLMEARKDPEKKRDWTDNEVVAQCFGFFIGAFETTSTTMCFGAHELMANPEVQQRLRAEVDEVKRQLDGKPISYEKLYGMKYLDMVVSETLRKWPASPFTDRECNKEYEFRVDDDEILKINVGDVCYLNILGLHHDPENFPDPAKFDPDRFSEENKEHIKPYTFLPFGSGNRSCIGNRLALMQLKAIYYYLLAEFTFEMGEKSTVPIELRTRGFQMQPKDGFWVKFRARS